MTASARAVLSVQPFSAAKMPQNFSVPEPRRTPGNQLFFSISSFRFSSSVQLISYCLPPLPAGSGWTIDFSLLSKIGKLILADFRR